jgi:hypothetical protein
MEGRHYLFLGDIPTSPKKDPRETIRPGSLLCRQLIDGFLDFFL